LRDTISNETKDTNQRGRFIELETDEWQRTSTGKWPTIAEFTNENVGLKKINEYIETEWKTAPGGQDPCWLYAIDFIEKKSLEFNELYIYRVMNSSKNNCFN
jgi:hypothetical protein